MEEMPYEKVVEFVRMVNSQNGSSFKAWIAQNNYSPVELQKLIEAVYEHHRNLNYLDTWSPIDDFEEVFREFDESLPYFKAVWEFLPEAAAGHLLKKPKKIVCSDNYFTPIAPKIIAYLITHHPDKYDGAIWIGSAKEKVIIKELFYCLKSEFELADHPSLQLSRVFEKATGIQISRRAFDNIKNYVKLDNAKELEYMRMKHKNFN